MESEKEGINKFKTDFVTLLKKYFVNHDITFNDLKSDPFSIFGIKIEIHYSDLDIHFEPIHTKVFNGNNEIHFTFNIDQTGMENTIKYLFNRIKEFSFEEIQINQICSLDSTDFCVSMVLY